MSVEAGGDGVGGSPQVGGVEHQADALISELRCAREAARLLERPAERLDDDVLLADQLVYDEPDPPLGDGGDDAIALRLALIQTPGR